MSGPKGTGETGVDSTAEGEAEMSAVPTRTSGAVSEQTKRRDRHLTLGPQGDLTASAECSVGKVCGLVPLNK